MEIDLFCELAQPPVSPEGGGPAGIGEIYANLLTVAGAADDLGFGALWLPEHHFLGDYSACPAPDLLLAAAARETRRLNLGVAIWPLPIHDPVRVAERLATLDALSAGRVLWGVGRGVTTTELEGFGEEPAASRETFLERFEELRLLLRDGCYDRGGRTYRLNPRPSATLGRGSIAAVSPETFDLAAELDLDVMTGPFKPWPMIEADLKRYRRLRPNGRASFTLACYCEADHAEARVRAERGLVWAYRRVFEVAEGVLSKQVTGYEHYRRLGWLVPVLKRMLRLSTLELMGLAAVGNADHVAERLCRLRDAGLDRVSLIIGGGDLSVGEQVACLERLNRDVMPRLRSQPAVATEPANDRVPA